MYVKIGLLVQLGSHILVYGQIAVFRRATTEINKYNIEATSKVDLTRAIV